MTRSKKSGLRTLAAALMVFGLTACSSTPRAQESDDQAEIIIRDMLHSGVIDQSRAGIQEQLDRGKPRSELVAMIDEQFRLGTISASTACLQTGLINGLSDDEIVDDCREAYQSEIDKSGQNPSNPY